MMPEIENNGQLVRSYLAWKRDAQRRREVTLDDYRCSLLSLVSHAGSTPLGALSPSKIEDWLQRPRGGRAGGRPGSAATIAKEVAVLRDLYKWLLAREKVQRNPTILLVAPSVQNQNPRPVQDAVWASVWASQGLSVSERVWLGLGAFCGLRRREMCELRLDQIDLVGARLVAFKRKGGGDDIFPMGDVLDVFEQKLAHLIPGGADTFLEPLEKLVAASSVQYLLDMGDVSPRQARKGSLAAGVTDPQALNRACNRLVERLGVERFTPHMLRHSFVSWLLRGGVPLHLVSRLANHSSPAVTMRYTKAGGAELREWLKAM